MNTRKFWLDKLVMLALMLLVVVPLTACSPKARVGELRTESQVVQLDDAKSVQTEINFGAGDLRISGGSEKLLEADFNYNVNQLKPEVTYKNGALTVRQPDTKGLPSLQNIADFRNEWVLRLNKNLPVDLRIDMGAGNGDLQLANLPLTKVSIALGAGITTINLNGDWAHDLDVTIQSGASDLRVQLPKDIGVRVEVDAGPTLIEATGLAKDGNVYTNAAYGVSPVTVLVHLETGIGRVSLETGE